MCDQISVLKDYCAAGGEQREEGKMGVWEIRWATVVQVRDGGGLLGDREKQRDSGVSRKCHLLMIECRGSWA